MEHATGDYFPLLKNQVNLLTVYDNSSILIKGDSNQSPHLALSPSNSRALFLSIDLQRKASLFLVLSQL